MPPPVFLSAGFMNFYSYQKDVSYSFNDSIINVRPCAFQSIIFFSLPRLSVITSFGNRCVRAIPNEFVQFGQAAAEHTLILLLLVASITRTYTRLPVYLTVCRGACI